MLCFLQYCVLKTQASVWQLVAWLLDATDNTKNSEFKLCATTGFLTTMDCNCHFVILVPYSGVENFVEVGR